MSAHRVETLERREARLLNQADDLECTLRDEHDGLSPSTLRDVLAALHGLRKDAAAAAQERQEMPAPLGRFTSPLHAIDPPSAA